MKIRYITVAAFLAMAFFSEQKINALVIPNNGNGGSSVIQTSPYYYTRNDVDGFVKSWIETEKGINISFIHNDDKLMEDLGIDSLDMFTLVIDCRNFFGLDNFNVADVLSHCRGLLPSACL